MKYKKSKIDKTAFLYGQFKNATPKTKKLVIISLIGFFFISAFLLAAGGFVIYKASSIIVNTIKIEKPEFNASNINELLKIAVGLQTDVQNAILSKECKDSLLKNVSVATFLLSSVDTIITNIKKDCLKPTQKEETATQS